MPAPDPILETLRSADRDRYLAMLVLPQAKRGAIAALYAFAAEVALTSERAREPQAGEIRLQWWAEALEGEGYGDVRANPVAAGLLDTVRAYNLPAGTLLRLINARRFDLYQDPMPDVSSFEGYAGEVNATLFQLAGMILADGNTLEDGTASGHLGVAQALIGHMRAFGFNASRGRIFLPWSVLSANGVEETEIFSGQTSEGLVEAFGQFHDMARDHLDKAEAGIAAVPPVARPALAPLPVLRRQLALLQSQPSRYTAPRDLADWRKLLLMAGWAWRNGR
jgi:phytoene synthase